jgi:poly-beta-hydroxyalkanoate depolymerase
MHDDNNEQAPRQESGSKWRSHAASIPLCRMFIFFSRCNKKSTSFHRAGCLSASLSRDGSRRRGLGALLYFAYQMQSDIMAPVRNWASAAANSGGGPLFAGHPALRNLSAVYELIARAGLTHTRPPFNIDFISIDGREVEVREKAAARTPFATLLHFSKDIAAAQPRVGVDQYTDHLIKFLEVIGPPAHIVAVCQPCVAALAAVAVMAQAANPAQPRSMTLMAGPIDTRVNPTKVNEVAKKRSIDWFERALTAAVPLRYPGAFRRVYPGFLQLVAFMSMNIERHVKAHRDLYEHLANGEFEKAAVTKAFYDEYFAVLDLTAEFYLETVRLIFQDHALPRGRLEWRGQRVDPNAIRKTMLFTVEGERDDICAVGQTMAAHELCGKLRPYLKRHHMQAGVGHYGVFSGKRWENQIYPILKNVILSTD